MVDFSIPVSLPDLKEWLSEGYSFSKQNLWTESQQNQKEMTLAPHLPPAQRRLCFDPPLSPSVLLKYWKPFPKSRPQGGRDL